ncbi:UDP-N-acetylmuramate dehydrogenase [Legionella longbeachae]|uniref:UDP-N-acetylenolpyruvoylglucosamine reductase n=1 Tax=Legionella longbeachae serogroup 1 (strain NSW150) TaxID=661367 RepID=D3HL67_LEGLN|nr:UDP-N-acetylmuramate dehydrogenase [Legionella longbeachae]VEE03693.1 UDP-N-acetylenolpyruvoylglucosamine reductase [Legionella oakridgensis]HBD7397502.1 UDP-N-acetylmuramate dehydrogenase [Legionella pneumophila]ARB93425.1 UDP-N-acetylmuramate dehydrogenase [Legionella longbeachae]ARM33470.1 UDP-N-acetylmuramate dehydrogenase [Legionella longbeachae]EEZ93679.1 UDP-N-acetylenolpyruvoylglucosamine reductase [Legionella longbeachae D-4968]
MSTIENDCDFTDKLQGTLLYNESLAEYTTWRVGGPAAKLYKPANIADLSLFLRQLPETEPLLWLGLGSNSLIRDGGFSGTVILTQGCLKEVALLDAQTIKVGAGVSCASMARFCARNDLSGGEFWAGIPGTMGGALRMNAGCHGGETWQSVIELQTMTRRGEIKIRKPEEYEVAYRHVLAPSDEWFVSATFKLNPGNKETSLQVIKDLLAHRANTQPTNEYNCGSVFRNPPGDYAARLIESCGLKGFTIGGAVVSQKHANFIINHQGSAIAADIEALIHLVQTKVREQTTIELMREVHIIGDY